MKKLLKIKANLYEILGIVLEYRIEYEMMQMSMLTRLVQTKVNKIFNVIMRTDTVDVLIKKNT